jgi:hypothetical protein
VLALHSTQSQHVDPKVLDARAGFFFVQIMMEKQVNCNVCAYPYMCVSVCIFVGMPEIGFELQSWYNRQIVVTPHWWQ